MDDENNTNLDVVFKNCKNDFHSFLSTIAKYLGEKTDFSTFDLTHVSELFANAANSSKSHNNVEKDTVALTNRDDNDTTDAPQPVQMIDDTSRDMFDIENNTNGNDDDDDEIIPETQFLPEDESNDSGESVTIPLFVKPNDTNHLFKSSEESHEDSEDELFQVHPESAIHDHTEQQSQMLMANMDRSILDDVDASFIGAIANSVEDSDVLLSTQTHAESKDTDTPVNGGRVDRSSSTTPDLDLAAESNGVLKEILAEQQENGNEDLVETQMDSQSVYDATTQVQQANTSTRSVEQDSTEDIFLASTQIPVFKAPTAVSTPRLKTKSKPIVAETQDSIYDALTQKPPEQRLPQDSVYEAATQADIYAADTQADIYEAATQAVQMDTSEDIYVAETQLPPSNEDIVFDAATQAMPSEKSSSSTKKTVTWKSLDEADVQKSNEHNVSDDLFDVETQIIEEPEPQDDASSTTDDLNDTEMFDMPTQTAEMPSTSRSMQNKRFKAVSTQSSQPANTPEWSLAARISNADIEKFEKEQAEAEAEREAQKRQERLKRNKYLFATSEDEDENDDDLEFDLPVPKPVERMSSLIESQKRKSHEDTLKRPSSVTSDESDHTSSVGGKIGMKRRVSVKVNRQEVVDYLKNTEKEQKSSKSSKLREKSTKAIEIKSPTPIKEPEQRNLRHRKSEVVVVPAETRNKRKASAHDETERNEKRGRKEPREVATLKKEATLASSKSKESEIKPRSAKKAKENIDNSTVITISHPDSSRLPSEKRQSSDRPSTRQFSRPAILFTKVDSAPYVNTIQNLGGFIVDTPLLGIPIVSSRWLDVSASKQKFEPTEPYLVVDKTSEKRFRFSLKQSLETARQTPLFVGYYVCTTPNVQPVTPEIAEIVECAGGKYADNPLKKRKPNTAAVLISHKKDSKMWKYYKDAHPDIQIVSSEGFLQSVMQQKINFSAHAL